MILLDDFSGAVDFVIVGSGIAGLRAAIALGAAGRVLILTKAEPSESNTGYAQGGIAAAFGDDDTPALHAADTLAAGAGLCDPGAVDVLVTEGPRDVQDLMDWGARFERDAAGRPALGREAAHRVRRVLHAGDATGREIAETLWRRASQSDAITTVNHALVTGLDVGEGGVAGVRFFTRDGQARTVAARAVLLATGGAGRVFRETTNPPVATGDGVALGYRAGAAVADLEFVQFHPTALSLTHAPRFLLSEALRGEGARLINDRGEPFMGGYDPAGDLAPRDIVARSIVREVDRTGGPVFLTLAHLDRAYVRGRFPMIAATLDGYGLDLASDPLPVGPAAHYMMGGVVTDVWGRTSVPGLFAAGEVACTGVHGANRLASNSLLEGLVFGARAASAMQETPAAATFGPAWRLVDGPGADPQVRPLSPLPSALSPDQVPDLMWRSVGLFRNRDRLASAVDGLAVAAASARQRMASTPADANGWRALNLVTVAWLVARAALRREESRGGHYREDFPGRDDERWHWHACERQATGRA